MYDTAALVQIANTRMPFGRFAERRLIDLPEAYLLWFVDRGFPAGRLGELMQMTLEIKINGLEYLLEPLKEDASSDTPGKRK